SAIFRVLRTCPRPAGSHVVRHDAERFYAWTMPACCAVLDSPYRRAVDSTRRQRAAGCLDSRGESLAAAAALDPGAGALAGGGRSLHFPRADWRTACCISGVGATPGR